MANGELYIVASVSGIYMFPTSKPYLTKNGIFKEYKKQVEASGDETLKVLKAQWIDADFDQYVELKIQSQEGNHDE